jgi:NADPH:quinone reductase-like Zn-dependent oxidoreductase
LKQLKAGDWVLVQGTGGVSMFALQFAKAAGAKVIATTSSAEKVETVKKLGADHVINYREDKDWGKTARSFTPNQDGVDHVVEVGGKDTMAQSLNAIKYGGVISVIGGVSGFQSNTSAIEALSRVCIFRGVMIGSRAQFEDMVRAIEANDLHPVLDKRVFSLKEVKQAYEYQVRQEPCVELHPRNTNLCEVVGVAYRKVGHQDGLNIFERYECQLFPGVLLSCLST